MPRAIQFPSTHSTAPAVRPHEEISEFPDRFPATCGHRGDGPWAPRTAATLPRRMRWQLPLRAINPRRIRKNPVRFSRRRHRFWVLSNTREHRQGDGRFGPDGVARGPRHVKLSAGGTSRGTYVKGKPPSGSDRSILRRSRCARRPMAKFLVELAEAWCDGSAQSGRPSKRPLPR